MPLKPKVQPPSETSSETRPTCKIFISFRPLISLKLVCQEKTRCKMILNEFIDKIEVEFVYETVQVEMAHVFVSSLVLNGTCYKGECGKNKKEDEQLAALSAILSLLGEQGSSGILVRKKKQDLVNSLPQIENKVNKTSLPQTEKQGGPGVLLDDTQCVSGHLPGAVTISRSSYVPLPITSAETISRCSYVNMPRTSPLVSEPQQEKSSFKRQLNQLLSKSVSLFLLQQQHTIRVMIRSFLERDEERTRRRQTRDCELRTSKL
ncbi:hypothetical protein Bca4012_046803 [Brassica carinata]